jgi:hypothetical protein
MQHESRLVKLSAFKGPNKVVIEFFLFYLLLLCCQLSPHHGLAHFGN